MNTGFIIQSKARQYQWSGSSWLSIKRFPKGSARYKIGNRDYLLANDECLIVNAGTNYQLTIDSDIETEALCIFFSPKLVSDLTMNIFASHKYLLDNPVIKDKNISLFERRYYLDKKIPPYPDLGKWMLEVSTEPLGSDEYFYNVLESIFDLNHHAFLAEKKIDFKKKSSREEVYRRIYYARDYIEANWGKSMTLSEIARVATMSPNHLLRCFKMIFQMTPFQYLTRLRLEKASTLLKNTCLPINVIAHSVGYESVSNFSTFFKSKYGASPSEFRKSDM